MFLKLCQYVKDLLNIWYVLDPFKTQKRAPWVLRLVFDQYNEVVEKSPDQFVTQKMYNGALKKSPWMLELIPDQYKTQEMYNEVVEESPWRLELVPDQYKTQKMCNEAVQSDPWMLEHVPDPLVTQKMCNEAVEKSPEVLRCYKGYKQRKAQKSKILRWYKGYEQRKAQKAKIKEELMPVAWHPDRLWNWCVPEDEKKELEIYFA